MIVPESDTQLFIRELSLYGIYSLWAVKVSICIIYIYLSTVVYLLHHRIFAGDGPMVIPNFVMAAFIAVTLLSIVINQKLKWKYRNFIIKGTPDNPIIVYMMCLPLLILSLVGLLFIFVNTLFLGLFPEGLQTFSVICVFVAMIVLLINNNGTTDTGESWAMNYSNCLTIGLSLLTLGAVCCYQFAMIHAKAFIECQNQMLGIPSGSDSSIEVLLKQTLSSILLLIRGCIVLLSLTFVTYFVVPLRRNIVALERYLGRLGSVHDSPHDDSPINAVSKYDIVCNTMIAVLLLLPHIIAQYTPYKDALPIISVVQLIVMIPPLIHIVRDVKFWLGTPRITEINVFNEIILWLGLVGELMMAIGHLSALVVGVYSRYTQFQHISWTLCHTVQFLQALLQYLFVLCINRRRLRKSMSKCQKIFRCLDPLIFLAVMNVVFLVGRLVNMYTTRDHNYESWRAVFITGLSAFGCPLMILYRCFCVLIMLQTVC